MRNHVRNELGVHRQTLTQHSPLGLSPQPQLLNVRPRFFRIDEVGGQRRNSSPVIDAGIDQVLIVRRGKIRRRLNIDLGE